MLLKLRLLLILQNGMMAPKTSLVETLMVKTSIFTEELPLLRAELYRVKLQLLVPSLKTKTSVMVKASFGGPLRKLLSKTNSPVLVV